MQSPSAWLHWFSPLLHTLILLFMFIYVEIPGCYCLMCVLEWVCNTEHLPLGSAMSFLLALCTVDPNKDCFELTERIDVGPVVFIGALGCKRCVWPHWTCPRWSGTTHRCCLRPSPWREPHTSHLRGEETDNFDICYGLHSKAVWKGRSIWLNWDCHIGLNFSHNLLSSHSHPHFIHSMSLAI